MEKIGKEKNLVNTIPMGPRIALLETGQKLEMLNSGMSRYRFIRDISFNDLENENELEFGSVLSGKVSLVLAGLPYSTRSARSQSTSAHDVPLKRDREDAVRLMDAVVAPRAYGSIFTSDSMFYHWSKSLLVAEDEVETMEEDWKEKEEKGSEMLEE